MTASRLLDTAPVRLGAKYPIPATPVVRIFADLEIAPDQLDAYKAAVTEEIDASIQKEAGVLGIHAVALRVAPTHLRFFEIYADEQAYRRHIVVPFQAVR